MSVGVMKDYKLKLRNLHASHALSCERRKKKEKRRAKKGKERKEKKICHKV